MPERHKVAASTCLNMGDFGTVLMVGVVFRFITPDWAPLFRTLYYLSLVGFVMSLILCPESPKWLLLQGRQKEAIRVLNKIAGLNLSQNRIPEDAEFIEAAIAKNLQNTEMYNPEHTIDGAVS